MKLRVRPSRPSSIVTLIVSVFLTVFGLGFLLVVGQVLAENEAPFLVRAGFYIVMVVWIGAAIATGVYHLRNARQGKGGDLLEIEGDTGEVAGGIPPGPMQRLRTLDGLKQDGLISEEEFQRKREEIMAQRW
jgi:hypothetical protein